MKHIGVGFCVAYPCLMGNAKAWSRGISNSTVPTLFLYALLLKTICKKALYGS